jgi:putative membrane protein
MRFVLNWVISALGLLIVGRVIPGFRVDGFGTALLAAFVLGLINATLGAVLLLLALPLTFLTFGLFHFVVMAFLIWLATAVVPGFQVSGFFPAFFGAIVLALVSTMMRALVAA